MAKLIPYNKNNSALVKPNKITSSSLAIKKTNIGAKIGAGENILLSIQKKVIKIDKLLKDSLVLKKIDIEKKRMSAEKKEFKKREEDLEKQKPKGIKGINLPSPPKLGIFDWIKNFIFNTLLGFIFVRLVDHLPKLIKLMPIIFKAGEFIIDIGGKLLNGLVTFIDWGYKAVDATRGFIKNIGGEGLAKNFDKFAGAIDNVLEIAIIAALATADSGVGGDLMDLGGDFIRDKLLKKGVQQAAQSGAQQVAGQAAGTVTQAGGIGVAGVTGIVAGVGLLASALGEGAFQLRKITTKPIEDAKRAYNNEKNPLMKLGRGAFLTGMSTLLGPLSAIGVLLDVIGAPFRYAIELLRFPFLSEKDKQKQAYNLAKLDARIREDFRKALNMVTLGFAFKEKGSFGNIYGNKDAQSEMMSKMNGGGRPTTRGGKLVGGPAKRTIKKKKVARTLSFTPRKIKPGASVGGEAKVQSVFPNPEKAWWDPLGAFTGKPQQPQQKSEKPKQKTANPQEFLIKSNDTLGRTDFFGPFFTLAIKSVLGQTPDQLDYKNAGKGLNSWMQRTFASGSVGFAGGGEVDASEFFRGDDYTNVIAKSVEESVSKEVNATIRNLAKEMTLKPVGREEMLQQNISPDEGIDQHDPNLDVGPGGTVTGGNADFWTLVAIASLESGNPQGRADVAQSIYNRLASGIYSGKTIKELIVSGNGRQYQPVGRAAAEFRAISDKASAINAIMVANKLSKSQAEKFINDTASAIQNKELQQSAAQFVGGRTDFWAKGLTPPANGVGYVVRHGHRFGWFVGPAAIAYGKKNPGPAKAPALGDITIMGGGAAAGAPMVAVKGGKAFPLPKGRIGTGSGQVYGAARSYGGHAGVDVVEAPPWGSDPKIPVVAYTGGKVVASSPRYSHKTSGYTSNLTIDHGPFKATYLHMKPGLSPGASVSPGQKVGNLIDLGNQTHLHFEAYDKSGKTINPTNLLRSASAFHGENFGVVPYDNFILKLHKGEMYKVVDKDSVDLLGFDLTKEIIDIENKSQLITRAPSIIEKLKSISGYTDYEQPYPEPEVEYIEVPIEVPVPMLMGGGGGYSGGGGSIDNSAYETLEML